VALYNCELCYGHSLPGSTEGQPGWCPDCHGLAFIERPDDRALTGAALVARLEELAEDSPGDGWRRLLAAARDEIRRLEGRTP
jgi:hypothetical protein